MTSKAAVRPPTRRSVLCGLLGGAVTPVWPTDLPGAEPLLQLAEPPRRFPRRAGELSVNVHGSVADRVRHVTFRLNRSGWREAGRGGPRLARSHFLIELRATELNAGLNTLEVRAVAGDEDLTEAMTFTYDPFPPVLPIRADWATAELDVQDGRWEIISAEGRARVRPTLGSERYDRLLAVTGAFPGGRRVETDVTFRRRTGSGKFGFGVFPLWGGHPDDGGVSPRRGWSYAAAWCYSAVRGLSAEFGYRFGGRPSTTRSATQPFQIKQGGRYEISCESWPELDDAGHHVRYSLRLHWRDVQTGEDRHLELAEPEPVLPAGEYAVALIAHRCQVEFGAVRVECFPLPTRQAARLTEARNVLCSQRGLPG